MGARKKRVKGGGKGGRRVARRIRIRAPGATCYFTSLADGDRSRGRLGFVDCGFAFGYVAISCGFIESSQTVWALYILETKY